ncbi:dihydrofolate reductase [Leucobacter chromiireducens]|uniref:dihydrofolate reductase n=1 Tax=Leucobacter chromiireducens TaxID=283877 RepID=UPI003075C79C
MSAAEAPRIGLIWAEAAGGAIGRDGDMPWHLPEDLAHFKRTTLGAPVIMGRRTWESLPARVRPLPGRDNIVVTRTPEYAAPGARLAESLEAALAQLRHSTAGDVDAWVMGGGQLYRAALPVATELVVTRIALEVPDADTFAPEIGAEWQRVEAGPEQVSATGLHFHIERWRRDAA